MEMLAKIFESSYTALFIGILIGALALSGKFNVTATQTLLALAWVVAIIGLRSTPAPVMIGAGAIIGGALILLGYLFRPDAIPGYSGVFSPKATLLFSAKNAEAPIVPKFQFGTSGVMYGAKELAQNPLKTILFPALSERQFKIESIDGKIKVSTQIHDLNDNLIVELDRNEWKVGPSAFDRNFTDDTLEVRDSSGAVVLQVKVLPGIVQLQGMWWINLGPPNGIVRFFIRGNPKNGGQIIIVPKFNKDPLPVIDPMFNYPSDRHMGELRQ